MNRSRSRMAYLGLLAGAALIGFAAASLTAAGAPDFDGGSTSAAKACPLTPDRILLRLEKAQTSEMSPSLLGRLQVLGDAGTAWIVEAEAELLNALAAAGIPTEVLDGDPSGKAYFLVFTPRPDDAEELRRFGNVRILEKETCLFWSGNGEAREILPARFEIVRLLSDPGRSLASAAAGGGAPGSSWGGYFRNTFGDAGIQQMAGEVSEANLGRAILDLQNFQTRYASTPNCEAAGEYLRGYFTALGLQTEFDPFSFSNNRYTTRNVIATLPGRKASEYIVIVCAHYDSTSTQAATYAPGADDDASGVAAVMEIARILAGRNFDFTLKFIGFSAEEWGLYGSSHYAQDAKSRGEKILAVLNLDMIAFTDRLPEDLDLVVNPRSAWLAARFALGAALFAPLNLLKIVGEGPSYGRSDHYPFWTAGYPALMAIEDLAVPNPYYHKTTDTYDKLNMNFAASAVRTILTVAAGLAQLRQP